jgi:heat-inducible transcriptional repressor
VGLRLFFDGLMEVGGAHSEAEHASIDGLAIAQSLSVKQPLYKACMALSGLSKCALLVLAPTEDLSVTDTEFLLLQEKRMLVILVFTNGQVENRMCDLPDGLPASAMIEASNYINSHYLEKPLSQTGCSMVLSPCWGSNNQIIGANGVIGPRHIKYAKIISMVDYTSETIARLLR